VDSEVSLRWALMPPPKRGFRETMRLAGQAVLTVSGLIAIALIALPWFVVLRFKEKREKTFDDTSRDDRIKALVLREDHTTQNQLTMINAVKDGWFRRTTLRFVLWTIHRAAIFYFNKGRLAGVPTIHFARFFLTDGNRRLFFLSNFDGSWESYLQDFIDIAAFGLTAVWTNARGFPATRFLFFGGAKHERQFKTFVRNSQIETQVWYSAYKRLSNENINRNSRIRNGLSRRMSESQAEEWLGLFR